MWKIEYKLKCYYKNFKIKSISTLNSINIYKSTIAKGWNWLDFKIWGTEMIHY